MILNNASTITQAIIARTTAQPDAAIMTFLGAGGAPESLTFGQLHADSLVIACRMASAGIGPGDVVVLAGEHEPWLIAALVATLYVGATPTIAPYSSAFKQTVRHQKRLRDIVKVSHAKAIIALPDLNTAMTEQVAELPCTVFDIKTLLTPDTPNQYSSRSIFTPEATAPAYVQFSSGTTGLPKGAVVTHANALRHLQMLVGLFKLSEKDVFVGWAPFYHDLGLVVYLLLPLVTGVPVVTIPPDYWVRRPLVLLRAIHDYCGTIAFMPGFGFNHSTRYIRQRDITGLDLRSMRLFIAGAEVIRPDVLEAFTLRFREIGLTPEAVQVGYGMTECVFMGSLTGQDTLPRIDSIDRQILLDKRLAIRSTDEHSLAVISCGTPPPGVMITICDEVGIPVPDRHLGEVVIDSPTLFDHYIHQNDLTAQTLKAGNLRTGDLGYLADGELFVVDRKKDLIISAGKHIYPESLEQIALAVAGDLGGRAAAFGVYSAALGTELPVLVCEVRGRLADDQEAHVLEAIRHQVYKGSNVLLADIRLVRRGWLAITTSGKVARSATREKYLASGYRPDSSGEALLRVARDKPALLEQALTTLFAEMLGLETVRPDDDFFELGGDSLTALRMVLAVEDAYDRRVPIEFFQAPTTSHLVRLLDGDEALPNAVISASMIRSEKQVVSLASSDIPKPKTRLRNSWRARLSRRRLVGRAQRILENVAFSGSYDQVRSRLNIWSRLAVKSGLYRTELSLLNQMQASLGKQTALSEDGQRAYLVGNMLMRQWRRLSRSGPTADTADVLTNSVQIFWQQLWRIMEDEDIEKTESAFSFTGWNHLETALDRGKGVLLVTYHSPGLPFASAVIESLVERGPIIHLVQYGGRKAVQMSQETDAPIALELQAATAERMILGYHTLRAGGVVAIANDFGYTPEGVVPCQIAGRKYEFKPTFAEIAWSTEAVILPCFAFCQPDGHIRTVFGPAFPAAGAFNDQADYVRQMIDCYADFLESSWRRHPESLLAGTIQRHLQRPAITNGVTS